MGKGDRRSRKGKIWRHSYGKTRKRKAEKKPAFVPKVKKEKKISLPKAEPVEMEVAAVANAAEATPKAAKPKKAAAPKKPKAEGEKKAAAPKKKPAAKKKD